MVGLIFECLWGFTQLLCIRECAAEEMLINQAFDNALIIVLR